MEKLKNLIGNYARWKELDLYIDRIEVSETTDFSLSLENAKALLESIAKEICIHNGVVLGRAESFNSTLKKAFVSLGYSNDDLVNQISRSLANIAQQMGNLRNEIGTTSHGRALNEIQERNNRVDDFTKEFLIDSTVLVACFLIRNFEQDTTINLTSDEELLVYEECDDFNQEWDEHYAETTMGSYSFLASEILFNLDYNDYVKEYKAFLLEPPAL